MRPQKSLQSAVCGVEIRICGLENRTSYLGGPWGLGIGIWVVFWNRVEENRF